MTATEVLITVVVIAVLAIIAVAAWFMVARWSLRQRFGPEYDRLVSERDSRTAAEKELRERARRHGELDLHPLSEEDRAGYVERWEQIQVRFVDEPNAAVADAAALVNDVVSRRGYPTSDRDELLAHLSVDHARSLDHFREGDLINESNGRGEATTEQLRQALVHYRALLADLLGNGTVTLTDPAKPEPSHP
jgi:Tfp pilus assembly protein FimT